jgi:uncharacterized protein YdhG (YjbR/CyaY superfamily)
MQYDVSTPQEYLDQIDSDWRKEKLLTVRAIILGSGYPLNEVIRYKMLGYEDAQGLFLSLNAQKNYVGLYVGDIAKIDEDGTLLKGINCGKGCVRIKKSNEVKGNIESFINKAIDYRSKGIDIDC